MLENLLSFQKQSLQLFNSFELYFCKPGKNHEQAAYIKQKSQNRLLITLSIILLIVQLYLTLAWNTPSTMTLSILSLIFLGLRFRLYKALRVLIVLVLLASPYKLIDSPLFMITPFLFSHTSLQVIFQTGSYHWMLIHLIANVLFIRFYMIGVINEKIRQMTIDEIAEGFSTAISQSIYLVIFTMVMKYRYDRHVAKLFQKIGSLNQDLAGKNTEIQAKNCQLQNNLETKDVFIYTFSHELKNALNGLLGNLTFASEATFDPKISHFLSSAKVCGGVLKNFIHNILDSGKLENGNLDVSLEKKNVMGFMRDAWAICGQVINNKRLDGNLQISKSVPKYLLLDGQRLLQIMLNLASNSVKFTEKGRVSFLIDWKVKDEPSETQPRLPRYSFDEVLGTFGDVKEFPKSSSGLRNNNRLCEDNHKKFLADKHLYQLNFKKWDWETDEVLDLDPEEGQKGVLRIQVIDSGCGMSQQQQSELFQKFSQVSSNPEQRKIGTGLGLWICKELTKRLDGDIKVRSTPGIGSVFEVEINTMVVRPNAVTAGRFSREQMAIPAEPITRDACSNLVQGYLQKVLIVDDDGFNVELMKNFLTKLGIQFICAYDGEEAVCQFKAHQSEIGMIITDNYMPKKKGTEVAAEISGYLKDSGKPLIPIVCISGDLKVNAKDNGIKIVLQKPINFDQLKKELSSVYHQLEEQ